MGLKLSEFQELYHRHFFEKTKTKLKKIGSIAKVCIPLVDLKKKLTKVDVDHVFRDLFAFVIGHGNLSTF